MIYDISPPISPSTVVWPGDTPPSREVLMDIATGDTVTLSTLHSTVHLAAHADAPSHYQANAPSIDERNLNLYLGPCQVFHVNTAKGELVRWDHLAHEIRATRILIRTDTFADWAHFNEDFAALDPTFVATCAGKGVRLIGIDTPSVDLFSSKTLPSHHTFLRYDMAILEGLDLSQVPEGIYELIALPLRLVGFDASPVRAILRTLD